MTFFTPKRITVERENLCNRLFGALKSKYGVYVKEIVTEGGWVWYIDTLKSEINRELTIKEIEFLMRECYIKGVSVTKAIELINNK